MTLGLTVILPGHTRYSNRIFKAGYFCLHNISRIYKYLCRETTECLVHAFISSRLDYCNSLLYELPDCLIAKLQRVQNSAARLVYMEPRFSHITPLLIKLLWLNVRSRISFLKIILITCKALYGKVPEYISVISLKRLRRLMDFVPTTDFYLEYCQKEHWPHLETEPSRLLVLSYGIVSNYSPKWR